MLSMSEACGVFLLLISSLRKHFLFLMAAISIAIVANKNGM